MRRASQGSLRPSVPQPPSLYSGWVLQFPFCSFAEINSILEERRGSTLEVLSPNHPSPAALGRSVSQLCRDPKEALAISCRALSACCTDGETETQKRQGFTQSNKPVSRLGPDLRSGLSPSLPDVRNKAAHNPPLPPSEYAAPPAQALSDSRAATLGAYGGRARGSRAPRSPGEGEGVERRRGDTGLVTSEPGARGGVKARGGGKSNRQAGAHVRAREPPGPGASPVPREPSFPAKFPPPLRLVGGGADP